MKDVLVRAPVLDDALCGLGEAEYEPELYFKPSWPHRLCSEVLRAHPGHFKGPALEVFRTSADGHRLAYQDDLKWTAKSLDEWALEQRETFGRAPVVLLDEDLNVVRRLA